MLTAVPVGLDPTFAASLPEYLLRKKKALPGEAATPAPDREKSEDLDGCDVEIAGATSDEDLPASEGGVA